MSPPQTSVRRSTIRHILAGGPVHSQEELAARLSEHGLETTQSMLSRDLRALGVAKRAGAYELVVEERVTPLEGLAALLRGARLAGEHLVCVFSEPGAASAVARALEAENLAGLVGTVAGDDTVFVAVESAPEGAALMARVLFLSPTD
ncbi:MAG: arginine repressor [Planctomycetes bacterium]|jgi:transcriptional regulator of arginine metabolism|nr:arginine repressor [Planctomycetota bacterium]MDP6410817.1 arginine repressor [Planctomycetota bacterium]